MDPRPTIRSLINRLARLDAGETWHDDLNPAQIAALDYLSRANRFSRAPSQVADYLGTTRGTMSQTLKALQRKGYVTELRSEVDRRSISFALTEKARAAVARAGLLDRALDGLDAGAQAELEARLRALLSGVLAANGGRAFGLCRDCVHHRVTAGGGFCALLSEPLAPAEAEEICHEQVPAAAQPGR
ncbi:MAG: MarR family transcriptional regulator [Rhodobacteraceae bacterium]|nr:MAG: MarR family transcriptional regulator [Paracoccaceae bacterium]